jgi:hypothetical protein
MGQFKINKGINKPVEFKGLKSQYLMYMAMGILGVFLIFIVIYLLGVNRYISLCFAFGSSLFLIYYIFYLNNTYGEHGVMKLAAKKNRPKYLTNQGKYVKNLQYKSK